MQNVALISREAILAKNKQIQNMILKGREHVQKGEYSKAVSAGERLVKAGESYGYVILAQAHSLKGKPNLAVEAVEKLTQEQPEQLYAWRLLAEIYRDTGSFEKAASAYEKALKCVDAPWQRIELARASMLVMAEKYEDALECLDSVLTEDLSISLPVESLKCTCFNSMAQYLKAEENALATIAKAENEGPEILESEYSALLYNLYYDLARAQWMQSHQGTKAIVALMKSIQHTNGAPVPSLRLLREINGQKLTGNEKTLRLHLRASLNQPIMSKGEAHYKYHREYDVACTDVSEAMEFIHELEFMANPGSIELVNARELRGTVNEFRGVYFQSPIQLEPNSA
tara:strand:- start:1523 stop:2551 length:1029 start_codon:yes stop_codon:yes gene_type:complete